MAPWSTISTTLTSLLLLCTSVALAVPTPGSLLPRYPVLQHDRGEDSVHKRDAKDVLLRLMPLGASITQGYGSSNGNGYRKPLRDQLREGGWEVNMVGSKRDGDMVDSDNEGHPGWIISEVKALLPQVLWMKPNLVTLNVGTNDCVRSIDIDKGADRLASIVDELFDSIPGVTVIVSTLLPNTVSAESGANVDAINEGFRAMVQERIAAEKRILLAEMNDGSFITADLLVDGTHPNDEGHKRMAAVWWDAVQRAEKAGFIQPADAEAMDDAETKVVGCDKGVLRGPTQTQKEGSAGEDDGPYAHAEEDRGDVFSPDGVGETAEGELADQAFFAELVAAPASGGRSRAEALDDLVRVDGDGKFSLWVNEGGGRFGQRQDLDPGLACSADSVAFGDLNNDGLDDVYCLSPSGAATVSVNRGGNPPSFENVGEVRSSVGEFPPAQVRVADVDGDGRADYCTLSTGGDVTCWRNGGVGDTPAFWQGFDGGSDNGSVVFGGGSGSGSGSGLEGKGFEGIVMADINGDFRDDLLWVGDSGEIYTFTNNRGTGEGLVPRFRASNQTHAGVTTKGVRKHVRLARIYGSGRRDYVFLNSTQTSQDKYTWSLAVRENKGHGGTQLKGDGDFYCDMRGTGSDDLVWISPDGKGHLYGRSSSSSSSSSSSNDSESAEWKDLGQVFDVQRPRKSIHLADWDGDGRCDVLAVNATSGLVEVWRNQHDNNNGSFAFAAQQQQGVAANLNCTQGWGVGPTDLGVRFADMDGDGRADYLCVEPYGRTTAFLNHGPGDDGLEYVGQVKLSVDLDRANLRFRDVTGDGRADLVWLDKYTGDARVWVNRGRIPASGSAFTWDDLGVVFAGQGDRGGNVYFADLGGLGRGDYHDVDPYSNAANTWFNECEGVAVGDDSSSDLPLPVYPGASS